MLPVDGKDEGKKRQEMSLLLRRLTLIIRRDAGAALLMRISHSLVIARVLTHESVVAVDSPGKRETRSRDLLHLAPCHPQ